MPIKMFKAQSLPELIGPSHEGVWFVKPDGTTRFDLYVVDGTNPVPVNKGNYNLFTQFATYSTFVTVPGTTYLIPNGDYVGSLNIKSGTSKYHSYSIHASGQLNYRAYPVISFQMGVGNTYVYLAFPQSMAPPQSTIYEHWRLEGRLDFVENNKFYMEYTVDFIGNDGKIRTSKMVHSSLMTMSGLEDVKFRVYIANGDTWGFSCDRFQLDEIMLPGQ